MKKNKRLSYKKIIYISFERGNDLTGKIGKKNRPFKTVLAAEKYSKKYKVYHLCILSESEIKDRKPRKLDLLHKLKISLSKKSFVLMIDTKKDHFIENQENIILQILKNGKIKEIKIQIIENEIEISDIKGRHHIILLENNKLPYKTIDIALRYF